MLNHTRYAMGPCSTKVTATETEAKMAATRQQSEKEIASEPSEDSKGLRKIYHALGFKKGYNFTLCMSIPQIP